MSVTNKEYFQSKLRRLSITMSDADLDVFFASKQIDGAFDLTKPDDMDKLFTEIVLELLIVPDISEDDYSIKYDRKSLESWYAMECSRLGIDDLLKKGKFQVKDISFLA
ncbi:hypothetical protein MKJ01_05640 [Chryseobacterium sp. SSA4.19]|uniref:DUF6706 family protein n=1 Tax=Chryseobacterium sp. SSA4.19 TaxID=2919915 RepID=UPI001F4DB544|nr:DUF6706 family protein [Chryseobacterium sp. SSA4.19]MCJ8153243.1 hypothetical protein [Chryseobacterium sp. SSA4.19]